MLAEEHGINFTWDGTVCEIVISEDVGYVLDVRSWCHGRFVYMIDKLYRHDLDAPEITVGQWHAPTEAKAKEEAEKAFLRHLNGGPLLLQ